MEHRKDFAQLLSNTKGMLYKTQIRIKSYGNMKRTYPAQCFDIVQSILRFQRRFASEKRHKTAPCNKAHSVHNMTFTKRTRVTLLYKLNFY